jgi:hypothetical protein
MKSAVLLEDLVSSESLRILLKELGTNCKMKHIKLFEDFVTEGIFLNYTQIVGNHDFKKFVEAYEELHKKEDMTWGFRKGSKDAHWKYDHETYRLQSDLQDQEVLGLINFKNVVGKNHAWSK